MGGEAGSVGGCGRLVPASHTHAVCKLRRDPCFFFWSLSKYVPPCCSVPDRRSSDSATGSGFRTVTRGTSPRWAASGLMGSKDTPGPSSQVSVSFFEPAFFVLRGMHSLTYYSMVLDFIFFPKKSQYHFSTRHVPEPSSREPSLRMYGRLREGRPASWLSPRSSDLVT